MKFFSSKKKVERSHFLDLGFKKIDETSDFRNIYEHPDIKSHTFIEAPNFKGVLIKDKRGVGDTADSLEYAINMLKNYVKEDSPLQRHVYGSLSTTAAPKFNGKTLGELSSAYLTMSVGYRELISKFAPEQKKPFEKALKDLVASIGPAENAVYDSVSTKSSVTVAKTHTVDDITSNFKKFQVGDKITFPVGYLKIDDVTFNVSLKGTETTLHTSWEVDGEKGKSDILLHNLKTWLVG